MEFIYTIYKYSNVSNRRAPRLLTSGEFFLSPIAY